MNDLNATPKRERFRFSLKSMLILLALVAVLLGSYAVGFRNGYRTAKDESTADYVIWKTPGTE